MCLLILFKQFFQFICSSITFLEQNLVFVSNIITNFEKKSQLNCLILKL